MIRRLPVPAGAPRGEPCLHVATVLAGSWASAARALPSMSQRWCASMHWQRLRMRRQRAPAAAATLLTLMLMARPATTTSLRQATPFLRMRRHSLRASWPSPPALSTRSHARKAGTFWRGEATCMASWARATGCRGTFPLQCVMLQRMVAQTRLASTSTAKTRTMAPALRTPTGRRCRRCLSRRASQQELTTLLPLKPPLASCIRGARPAAGGWGTRGCRPLATTSLTLSATLATMALAPMVGPLSATGLARPALPPFPRGR